MSEKKNQLHRWRNPSAINTVGAQSISQSLALGSNLRRHLAKTTAIGTFIIDLPHPSTVTTLAAAGFDFVVLDMEHSSLDFYGLEHLINACRAARLPALVRPWGVDRGLIGKILDLGAHGIMAPHVDSADRARSIVAEARFAPLGARGFSPITKFDGFERPLQALEEGTFVVAQIEGSSALQHGREISSVKGIDAIFVGPYDLALSLGVEPGSQAVYEAAAQLSRDVPPGVAMGLYIDKPEHSAKWSELGFNLQCVSFDGRMLADNAREVLGRAGRPARDKE